MLGLHHAASGLRDLQISSRSHSPPVAKGRLYLLFSGRCVLRGAVGGGVLQLLISGERAYPYPYYKGIQLHLVSRLFV